MIVIFQRDRLNRIASLALRDNSKGKIYHYLDVKDTSFSEDDNRLIILDLVADGTIQSTFGQTVCFEGFFHLLGDANFRRRFNNESNLAEIIYSWNLPSSVQTIDLCVSEVKPGGYDSLYNIGCHIVTRFENIYKRKITVRIPSHDHYNYTFIVPPEGEKKEFEIYEILQSSFKGTPSFQNFLSVEDKTLLWSGQNMDEWFSHPLRQIASSKIILEKEEDAKSELSVRADVKASRKHERDADIDSEQPPSPTKKLTPTLSLTSPSLRLSSSSSSSLLFSSNTVAASLPSVNPFVEDDDVSLSSHSPIELYNALLKKFDGNKGQLRSFIETQGEEQSIDRQPSPLRISAGDSKLLSA